MKLVELVRSKLNSQIGWLQKRSEGVRVSFKDMVQELDEINAKIDERVLEVDGMIIDAQSQRRTLMEQRTDNQKFKEKIENLLS